ncbi:MAG: radical SAM family heme chaperone HemW [Acidobacteria bacterium]|nr:radical SAM family heme chaperone HemW [Acidobacteriota bacterium]
MSPPFGAGFAAYPATGVASDLAPAFGVYVHIPFCPYKCPYCDFNVHVGASAAEVGAYLDALAREAEWWAARHGPFPAAGSLYLGGGTPTMVDPGLLAGAVARIRGVLPLAPGAEVSVEANPETVTAGGLAALRAAGANRLSVGAQSFSRPVLAALGRRHSPEDVRRAVRAAREAGFADVSLDLIYGGPGEDAAAWRESLGEALALAPEHLSCYALTIERPTALGHAVATGRMAAPDDEDQASKLEAALDVLQGAGYRHYEISNWARPGRESRHNLVYWTQGEYLGLGAGAHSHIAGVRFWNRKLPRAYAADPRAARAGEERLDPAARAEEWLQLRLRLIEGVDLAEARARLGRDLRADAEVLREAGLVRVAGGRLTLTRRGLLLENEVALRLGG